MKYKKSRKSYPEGVLAIYDNGGKTADRYTVVYAPKHGEYGVTGMSDAPYSPQGVCMHATYKFRLTKYDFMHFVKLVNMKELPQPCRRVVWEDLGYPDTEAREAAANFS